MQLLKKKKEPMTDKWNGSSNNSYNRVKYCLYFLKDGINVSPSTSVLKPLIPFSECLVLPKFTIIESCYSRMSTVDFLFLINITGDSAFNMLNFFSRIQDNGFKLQLTLQLDNRRFTWKPYIFNMDRLLGFVNIEDIYIFQTGTQSLSL